MHHNTIDKHIQNVSLKWRSDTQYVNEICGVVGKVGREEKVGNGCERCLEGVNWGENGLGE